MLYYILQVAVLQFLFLLFYNWFLRKETFFQWNRFYLIATAVLSFVIPILRLGWLKQNQGLTERLAPVIIGSNQLEQNIQVHIEQNYHNQILMLYLFGVILFTFLFLVKLYKIYALINHNKVLKQDNYSIVLLSGQKEAFSFMKYVFVNQEQYQNDSLQILRHELVHLKEKHWLDLLFFEFLKIVFWFNPLLWIYQKEISLLHEFIADSNVLKDRSFTDYFNELLQETFKVKKVSFINQFYQPKFLKKRIMMQKRNPSKHWAKVKYAVFTVLLIGFVFIVDACKDEMEPTENVITTEELKAIKTEDIKKIEVTKNPDKITIIKQNDEKLVYYPEDDDLSSVKVFGKKINTENQEEDDVEVAFQFLKNPPVFPGCEGLSGKEAKDCMSKKIQHFISQNFNINLAKELNLEGERVKILTQFTIDKQGEIINIKSRSKYKKLEEEAKRVIALLPTAIEPAQQHGKTVKVTYTLPIIFKVE